MLIADSISSDIGKIDNKTALNLNSFFSDFVGAKKKKKKKKKKKTNQLTN